jgi:hypothetical protein
VVTDPQTAAALGGGFAFIAPAATVTVAAGQKIVAISDASLGSAAVGGASGLSLNMCYQPSAGGAVLPFAVLSEIASLTAAQGERKVFSLNAAYVGLGAGSYKVGLCGNAAVANQWNSNDFGHTTALVTN